IYRINRIEVSNVVAAKLTTIIDTIVVEISAGIIRPFANLTAPSTNTPRPSPFASVKLEYVASNSVLDENNVTTASMEMSARIPSPNAPKYQTKRASASLFNCVDDVHDDTSPWIHAIAPHCIVINSNRNQDTSFVALVTGAVIVGFVKNNPKYKIAKPTTN